MNRLETILSHNLPMTFTFAQVFLAALCFYFLVHSVTCLAEIIHLKRTIHEVPEPLREKITLPQHKKAAHYDIARTKLNWLEVTVTTLLIIYLTAGNGINTISDWLMNTVGDQFAFHWMLPASIGFIFVLCDLPFCWYKEFHLREAFGYTKQDPSSWFKNYWLTTLLGWLTVLPLLWIGLFLWQNSGPMWWILGWAIFAVYLVFSLNLARRLVYLFKPNRAQLAHNDELKRVIDALGEKAGLSVAEIRVAKAKDNEELPPAFAFGHRHGVKLFFRHDIYNRMTLSDLQAVAAHALSRNLSHMYFQAWFLCALAGFFVFAFLAWFAPQSWFLDEIGFRVYGPSPYYGSVLTFAIVALPVLLFPFRLPMDAFLRHLIFASDTFAMKHTGLKVTVNSLIELFPTPMRHSSVTLGFFDLLFSHEPSLMARICHVQRKSEILEARRQEEALRNDSLTVLHQLENVSSALISKQEQKVLDAEAREKRLHKLSRQFEKALKRKAEGEMGVRPALPLEAYRDPHYEEAMQDLAASNITHPMYGKSLLDGLRDIVQKLREARKSKNASEKPDEKVVAPASEIVEESTQSSEPAEPALQTPIVSNDEKVALPLEEVKKQEAPSVAVQVETPPVNKEPQSSQPTKETLDESQEKPLEQTAENSIQEESAEIAVPEVPQSSVSNEETTASAIESEAESTQTNDVPLFGKASRRATALRIMAQRQRELFEKTHSNAA